jgi:hypothetical protein
VNICIISYVCKTAHLFLKEFISADRLVKTYQNDNRRNQGKAKHKRCLSPLRNKHQQEQTHQLSFSRRQNTKYASVCRNKHGVLL